MSQPLPVGMVGYSEYFDLELKEKLSFNLMKNEINKFLLPTSKMLDLDVIEISEEQKDKIKNGLSLETIEDMEENKIIQLYYEDNLAAIAKIENLKIKPIKVLC